MYYLAETARVICYLLLDNSRKVVSCGKERRRGEYVLKSHQEKHSDLVCHDVNVGGEEIVFRGAIRLAALYR